MDHIYFFYKFYQKEENKELSMMEKVKKKLKRTKHSSLVEHMVHDWRKRRRKWRRGKEGKEGEGDGTLQHALFGRLQQGFPMCPWLTWYSLHSLGLAPAYSSLPSAGLSHHTHLWFISFSWLTHFGIPFGCTLPTHSHGFLTHVRVLTNGRVSFKESSGPLEPLEVLLISKRESNGHSTLKASDCF